MMAVLESQILPYLAECAAEEYRNDLREEANAQVAKTAKELLQRQSVLFERRRHADELDRTAQALLESAEQDVCKAVLDLQEEQHEERKGKLLQTAQELLNSTLDKGMAAIDAHKDSRLVELQSRFRSIVKETSTMKRTDAQKEFAKSVLTAGTIEEAEALLFSEEEEAAVQRQFENADPAAPANPSIATSEYPSDDQLQADIFTVVEKSRSIRLELAAAARQAPVWRPSAAEIMPPEFVTECQTLAWQSRETTASIAEEWLQTLLAWVASIQADWKEQQKECEREAHELSKALDVLSEEATQEKDMGTKSEGSKSTKFRLAIQAWREKVEKERARLLTAEETKARIKWQSKVHESETHRAADLKSLTQSITSIATSSLSSHSDGGKTAQKQHLEKKLRELESRELHLRHQMAHASTELERAEKDILQVAHQTLVDVRLPVIRGNDNSAKKGDKLDDKNPKRMTKSKVAVHMVLEEEFELWCPEKKEKVVNEMKRLTGLQLDIQKVRPGSIVIDAEVLPDAVNAELAAYLQDGNVRRQLATCLHCRLLLIGNYGMDLNGNHGNVLNPLFNRVYSRARLSQEQVVAQAGVGAKRLFWEGAVQDQHDRGGHPYFCPEGWTRFGIQVGTQQEFDRKYNGWHIAYHGTKQGAVGPILLSTLRQGHRAAQGPGIYLTPSLQYASHPSYAEFWRLDDNTEVQVVLQCRVRPAAIAARRRATRAYPPDGSRIDAHFPNEELHWLVRPPSGNDGFAGEDQLVCYGILIRKRTTIPGPSNFWGIFS